MSTDNYEDEIEYGKWNEYTADESLAEAYKLYPIKSAQNIWPDWSEGVPTKLQLRVRSPSFFLNGV